MLEFSDSGRPLTKSDIKNAERELALKFPADYRAFMLRTNGGAPTPSAFPVPEDNEEEWDVHCIYSIADSRGPLPLDLVQMNEHFRSECELPEQWLAVGAFDMGVLLLSLSEDDFGALFLWYVITGSEEFEVYRMADSFSGFLSILDGSPPTTEQTEQPDSASLSAEDDHLVTNSIGMRLALIRPGEFTMGSPDNEKGHYGNEGPLHAVIVSKPFYLGVYPVTQGEFQRVMGRNPSHFTGNKRLPVEQVAWDVAIQFCQKLSESPEERQAGRTYRLPTEAEWEYACRAGSTTAYCFGDKQAQLADFAWYKKNAGRRTHAVGEKKPNAWGLYDMHGNVWEWCQDWYGQDYYGESPENDPTGPAEAPERGSQPAEESRVHRGGCWDRAADRCRSASRYGSYPISEDSFQGFRVVAEVSGSP